jgi:hypothetical protein
MTRIGPAVRCRIRIRVSEIPMRWRLPGLGTAPV